MSPETFACILSACSRGVRIEVESTGAQGLIRSTGILVRFDSDGVFVESDSGREFISREIIVRLKVGVSTDAQAPTESIALQPTVRDRDTVSSVPSDPQDKPILPPLSSPSLVVSEGNDTKAPGDQSSHPFKPSHIRTATDPDWQLLFAPVPQLSPPEPNFQIEHLHADAREVLVRAKNRYEYALKINELGRIRSDIAPLIRQASALQNAGLFMVAGVLALKLKDIEKAKECLALSDELNDSAGAYGLAYLAVSDGEWRRAAEKSIRALLLKASFSENDYDLVQNLGRCLYRLDDRELPGLAELVQRTQGSLISDLVATVAAFSLHSKNPEAARLLRAGLVDKAQIAASDSVVFTKAVILQERLKELERSRRSADFTGFAALNGRITGFYPYGRFGFIYEENTGHTYHFSVDRVSDQTLRSQLLENRTGQKVTFTPPSASVVAGARYPTVTAVTPLQVSEHEPGTVLDKSQDSLPSRPLLPSNVTALPKGASSYAKAKRAELVGKLDEAETMFREEIDRNGAFRSSAIMDLAALLSRRDRCDDAITLLSSNRRNFENTRAVDNHLTSIYMRAMRFREAAAMFHRLQQGADTRGRLNLSRQEAYCYFALGEYGKALAILENIQRTYSGDAQIRNLIERVRSAQSSGALGQQAREDLAADLGAFSYGLSRFDLAILDTCEYRMVDERSRSRGFFEPRDFEVMQRHFENLRGRRPREKADCLLTLAAMAHKNPEAAGDKSTEYYLVRSLTFMAEAALYERLHPDTARSFVAEALRLSSKGRDIEHPICLLLMTYLTNPPDSSEWAQDGFWQITKVLPQFTTDPTGWQRVLTDMPYYEAMFSQVSRQVGRHALRHGLPAPELTDAERVRKAADTALQKLQDELSRLRALLGQPLTQGALQETATTLRHAAGQTRFSLDKDRYGRLASILEMAPSYFNERDYSEKENKVGRMLSALVDLADEIPRMPTKLSIEGLRDFVNRCHDFLATNFRAYVSSAVPRLELTDVLGKDYYIPGEDGIIRMTVSIMSKPGGAPVEGTDVVIADDEGITMAQPCHSAQVLRAGESRELELLVRPTPSQLMDQAFSIRSHLRYRLRNGESAISEEFTLPVRLGNPADFQSIPNPYGQYSGGKVVADPTMFYGRKELLNRVIDSLVQEPHGHCFVLYGQKRSGKTSLLEQVRQRLAKPVFSAYVTLGAIGTDRPEANFVWECANSIRDRLEDDFDIQPTTWPTASELRETPQQAFLKVIRSTSAALKTGGWGDSKIVLLVDEFTYLYEYIVEGIVPRHFMHFWKSLLDRRVFSAVVVGQDSMPKFIKEFPNDFGVTREERITYLTETEARALAEEPLRFRSESRYRGGALQRLMSLTAGGPYYLQIFCDRLVRHLNQERANFITEADVSIVGRKLVSGPDSLPDTVFDPLISAAGDSVAEAKRDVYLRLLKLISLQSERTGAVSVVEEPGLSGFESLLQDMKDRDVISVDPAGRISIRVGLFAEWLRVNRDIV